MSMEFYGKTIFITGATGCVGNVLLRTLLKEGWTIKTLARTANEAAALNKAGAQAVMGDITNAASMRQAIQGSNFVFHLSGVDDSHAPPAAGQPSLSVCARAVAEACLQAQVERLLFLSDSIVYGYDAAEDTSETSPMSSSREPAIAERVRAEQAVQKVCERGLAAIILQPTTIYGPQEEAWTMQLLRLIDEDNLICPNEGKGLIQPIHIYDVAEGILTAALVGIPGASYLLTGSKAVTCQTFLDCYARILGRAEVPASGSGFFSGLFGRKPSLEPWQVRCASMQATYNGAKAYFDMGFLPRYTLELGMQQTEQWLRKRVK